MTASDVDVLKQIVTNLPNTIDALGLSVTDITAAVADLQDQQDAIENAVMGPMTSASDTFGDAWQAEFYSAFTRITSGGYGVTNLDDWGIVDTTLGKDNAAYNQFKSNQIVSGGPALSGSGWVSLEALQYDRQVEFPQAYEHVNEVLSSTATYGILDRRTKLGTALTLTTNNEAKYTQVLKIYKKYDETD
jgi:hypothetical protein